MSRCNLRDLIFGALLHDIGKIIQRSDGERKQHSLKGEEYIKDKAGDILKEKSILDCIRYHHYNDLKGSNLDKSSLAYIVYEADNIASGSERRESSKPKEGLEFDSNALLESIFNRVKDTKSINYYYRLQDLQNVENFEKMDEILISESNSKKIEDAKNTSKDNYTKIKQSFDKKLKNIETPNSLLQLLEATSSYIPSSTNQNETVDISLYEHSKLTAAIASCMYLWFDEKFDEEEIRDYKSYCLSKKERNNKYFLLVSADISGIQDFIYTIVSKGALKSLRGRSFFLEILLEHLVDELLEELKLSRCNCLYTGGGHFYLLLPNTEKTKELITKFEKNINGWFLKNFDVSLYIAIAHKETSSNEMINKPKNKTKNKTSPRENLVGNLFRDVSIKLSKKKIQRYTKNQLKEIFDVDGEYGKLAENSKECSICHTSSKKIKEYDKKNLKELGGICCFCKNLFLLGEKLVELDRKKEYHMLPITTEKISNFSNFYIKLPSLSPQKKYLTIKTFLNTNSANGYKQDYFKSKRIYAKNRFTTGIKFATTLWMGDYVKKKIDDRTTSTPDIISAKIVSSDCVKEINGRTTMSFEELSKPNNKDEVGIQRVAILRADVDSLGSTFISGFEQKKGGEKKGDESDDRYRYVTMSRYATLSRQLSLFFKHYINAFCKDKKLIIIYSGGDDIFVAGYWEDVLCFAKKLRSEFNKFTCGKLTISAGVGFYTPKFPIYKMANLTGKLEEFAKEYPDKKNPTKNAIALFGIDNAVFENEDSKKNSNARFVFSWDEFDEIIKTVEDIEEHCYFQESKKDKTKLFLSKAFIYKIISLIAPHEKSINLARLAYSIARLEPNEDNIKSYDYIKKLLYCRCSKDLEVSKKQLLSALYILIYKYRNAKN